MPRTRPPGSAGGSATLASIAAELGVSVPTVSKVLNGRSDVAPATRAKIEEALARHQYKRRKRGPASIGPPLIDLAFHELDSAWAIEIIRGVETAAASAGAGVVLSEFGGKHRPQQEWFDAVLARRPLGVILVLSSLGQEQQHQLESRSIPFVVVDTAGELPAGVATVGSNNWSGGIAATRHLIGLGHRRVAVVSGPANVLCSRARIDGFRSAHDEAGMTVDPDLVRHGDFTVAGGYRHGKELLARPDRPTAVFAGSDMQALGVLRAARELGLRVPEDLSVVGYDDVPLSEWIGPALTTVRQPLRSMASTATTMLVDLARGENPPLRRVELATELIVRESTAPPARVADLGCGSGWSTIAIARGFPAARVEGIDVDEASIESARRNAIETSTAARVTFACRDATDPALAGRYDLVTMFETLHDMAHPVDALRAARTLLTPGGAVLVGDERVAETFTAPGDELDRFNYGWSALHCLAVAMVEPDAAGTGTVIRPDTVRRYAHDAGFSAVTVLPIEHDFWRFYRLDP